MKKTYERGGIYYFMSIKNSTENLHKLKTKGFQASTISTYDFSTLYTTLPHKAMNRIARKLLSFSHHVYLKHQKSNSMKE